MGSRREISFSQECEIAAEKLGGFKKIDPALDPVWDGLNKNPFGFDTIETDWSHSARYAVTGSTGNCPMLLWLFVIDENKNVEIIHVEPFEKY